MVGGIVNVQEIHDEELFSGYHLTQRQPYGPDTPAQAVTSVQQASKGHKGQFSAPINDHKCYTTRGIRDQALYPQLLK